MDFARIFNLLWRTVGKRGLRQVAQQRMTGKVADPAKRREMQQNMRRASQALRVIRRFGKF